MNWWLAQVICLGLVVVDLLARAWRIQLLVQGTGERLSVGDGLAVNLIGDGASAVTPLRLGGEPARIGVLLTSGVSLAGTVVASGYEILITWPVLIASALLIGWAYGSAWWVDVGPRVVDAVLVWWPWVAGIVLLSVLAWLAASWWKPRAGQARWIQSWNDALHRWRAMPWALVARSIPLTVVSIFARTAILPVLALTIPDPPALGSVVLGSFVLLFGQLVLPTPAGVGAVEFGFLAGAAGSLGADRVLVLTLWRFYTTGVGVVAAAWLVARRYGWGAVRQFLTVRSAGVEPGEPGSTG